MKTLTLKTDLQSRLDRLEKIQHPVSNLFYKGVDINTCIDKPTVAIVGTRKPSPYGISQTTLIAEDLAKAEAVIVSGLALGVDAIAHSSALEVEGSCIAVLPSDVDHIYPATNRQLADKILSSKRGALISEYEDNKAPKKVDFLIRNRIVAALSDAVIVTEAAAQSGTLNTARHAREMGIPIYAVPGNVTSPMSAGCNWLIQNGAKLLTNAEELLRDIGVNTEPQQVLDLSSNSPEETLVLQKIALGFTLTDELIHETAMKFDELQQILTMLEIDGKLQQNSQGSWELRR